ncbi:MAG: formyltransferase family protein [Pseudomonadota bacterium]|nr:formyltransferase family protein [Pseudomonadota bacterium]
MRVVILTTHSVRRRFLVRELRNFASVERAFVETRGAEAQFETDHPFEAKCKPHETDSWFGGKAPSFSEIADVEYFETLNSPDAVEAIRAARPDIIIVFGTGKLSREIISICPRGCVNIHGGDPEQYRGLDASLWAVYHGDFGALMTTVQILAPELDCGDIVAQHAVTVTPGMKLHALRRAGTESAIPALRDALREFAKDGSISGRPLAQKGRYYSHMPSVLKEICLKRFERHTDRLLEAA